MNHLAGVRLFAGADLDVRHVVPLEDLRPHRAGDDCECQPTVMHRLTYVLLVHHAWDGRKDINPDE